MIRDLSRDDPALLAGVAAAAGGALAILDPFFRGLTEAAAALALVAWVPRLRTRGRHPSTTPARLLAGLGSLVVGGVLFFVLPPPVEGIGALALGGSALALSGWAPTCPGAVPT
ncbi:MAG TPA: hypothetical protein VMH90_03025 [Thermoplasmata archaeon]|nr:hypothetical protein [Thermoplasmata archaeon]